MPTTYKKADAETKKMAQFLLAEFPSHAPTLESQVKIDLLFAFPEYDETSGEPVPVGDALKCHGVKALGITRIISLKDRTKGLGDCEICLDGDWWKEADEGERRALLDHELHHIVVTKKMDDLGRPKLKMRKHDVQIGWFAEIAKRHGARSQERKQAAAMIEQFGQFFFPEILANVDQGRIHKLEVRASK